MYFFCFIEKKQEQAQQRTKPRTTARFYVVQQCAYIHGKMHLIIITFIMEITSSIQAEASFDLSQFLYDKTSLNLLALYHLLNSLSLYEKPLFSHLHDQEFIYTSC